MAPILILAQLFFSGNLFSQEIPEEKDTITPEIIHPKDLGTWDYQFTKAKEELEMGRSRQALKILGMLLSQDPSDKEAWNLMALALRKRQDYLRALRIYYFLSAHLGELGKNTLSEKEGASWDNIQNLYGKGYYPQKEEAQYLLDIAHTFIEYAISIKSKSPEVANDAEALAEKYLKLCDKMNYREATVSYLRGLLYKNQGKDISAGASFYQAYKKSLSDPDQSQKASSDYELLAGHKFTLDGRPEIASHFYRSLEYNEEAHHHSRFLAQRSAQDLAHGGTNFYLSLGMEKSDNIQLFDDQDKTNVDSDRLLREISINEDQSQKFSFKANYLTDPTDWWLADISLLFKNQDFQDKRLSDYDKRIWGIGANFQWAISTYWDFLIQSQYTSQSGKFYEQGFIFNDSSTLAISPGLKITSDYSSYSLLLPFQNQSRSGETASSLNWFGPQFVWDFFQQSEWLAPLLNVGFNQLFSSDFAGGGSKWSFNISNRMRPSLQSFFSVHFSFENTTRDLESYNERLEKIGLIFSFAPLKSFRRWELEARAFRTLIYRGNEFQNKGKQDNLYAGSFVYF